MSKMLQDSERKFTLTMEPIDGVKLKDCTLKVEAYAYANRSVALDEKHIIRKDDDSVKVLITSDVARQIGGGQIKLKVYLGIPDADFPDGYRNQVYEVCE